MTSMVRKQVYLTAELDARLRSEAARQRRSEAEILREALAAHLKLRNAEGVNPDNDSLWSLVGVGGSGSTDLSENVDDILYGPPRES